MDYADFKYKDEQESSLLRRSRSASWRIGNRLNQNNKLFVIASVISIWLRIIIPVRVRIWWVYHRRRAKQSVGSMHATNRLLRAFLPTVRKALAMTMLVVLASCNAFATTDSLIQNLKFKLQNCKDDTTRINLLNSLAWKLSKVNPNEALEHANEALNISERLGNKKFLANSFHQMAWSNYVQGNYSRALEYNFKAIK